jgi:hypothetical protein
MARKKQAVDADDVAGLRLRGVSAVACSVLAYGVLALLDALRKVTLRAARLADRIDFVD